MIEKLKCIKQALGNDTITVEESCELMDDLICEMEECDGPFSMGSSDDDYYETFEETDFSNMYTEEL